VTDTPAIARALCFGEALIDQFPDRRVVAGAPLHVAARLAGFRWHAYLVTRVGEDGDGLSIAQTLRRHGVDDALVEVDPELPTGVTVIEMNGTSHEFTIEYPAAWDAIEGPDPAPAHDVLYYGTLALRDRRSRAAWQRLITASNALKVIDVNLRPPHVDRNLVESAVDHADILKMSDTELEQLVDLLDLSDGPRDLLRRGSWLCVTHGSRGAELWHEDGGHWTVKGIDTDVVDTVGAGDAFTAGIVHALFSGVDGEEALTLANEHAASTVGRRGGLPDPLDGEPPRATTMA
jgi:fructokinase